MMIRLCCLHQEDWRCPSQIQNCFPRPLEASSLLLDALGWTIGSWGHRPTTASGSILPRGAWVGALGPRPKGNESHSAGPGSDDVHIIGPGEPPLADLGRYEGGRQASLSGLPNLPGRPIRRSGGGLFPTVLHHTEADGGVSSYPAPAVLQSLHLLIAEGALLLPPPPLQLGHSSSLHNGRSVDTASAPAKLVKRQGRRRPWDGRPGASGSCSSGDGDCTTPSPGGGLGGESFVSFLFCSATGPRANGTQNLKKKKTVTFFRVPRGRGWQSPHSRPPLLSPVGSRVRFEEAMPSPTPSAQPLSQVSVTPTSMSQSSLHTGHFSALRSKGEHISTRLGLGIENRFWFQNRILKVRNRILVVKLKFRFCLSIPMRFCFSSSVRTSVT